MKPVKQGNRRNQFYAKTIEHDKGIDAKINKLPQWNEPVRVKFSGNSKELVKRARKAEEKWQGDRRFYK